MTGLEAHDLKKIDLILSLSRTPRRPLLFFSRIQQASALSLEQGLGQENRILQPRNQVRFWITI
jgi:hypothetical protein